MTTTNTPRIELSIDRKVTGLWCASLGLDLSDIDRIWYYGPGESNDPGDRVGGPFTIHRVIADYGTDRWFLFFDTSFGHWPTAILVGSDGGMEDALETILEEVESTWLDNVGLEDYGDDVIYNCDGKPCSTDYITGGGEVVLLRVDF